MYDYQQPDAKGHFGIYGGSFVSETLTHAINELKDAYAKYQHDPEFIAEFKSELAHFVGRPSPIYHAARMSREMGGAQIFLKREDLNHTGAHKINNTIGQAMLAKRMGKTRIIAETGAGQHGVATATICARYGLECVVYMGSEDVKRQSPNVYRMKLLGATVIPVESGSKTLKDALNEAMRDWVANVDNTFYIIGTVAGPHPYPMMVRDFQSVIGEECLTQMPEMLKSLKMATSPDDMHPDAVIACVGGGSNAMGIFYPYIAHENTRLIGVEAAGEGMDSGKHSCSLQCGSPGVLHGNRTYVLQDDNGQITETHSVSAGLDYPGVGPEHAFLKDIGRAEYVGITDKEALEAFHYLCRTEGIIPALESSHAVAYAMKLAKTMRSDQSILVNLSGRGDKDIGTVADLSSADFYCRPSCRGQSVKGDSTDSKFVSFDFEYQNWLDQKISLMVHQLSAGNIRLASDAVTKESGMLVFITETNGKAPYSEWLNLEIQLKKIIADVDSIKAERAKKALSLWRKLSEKSEAKRSQREATNEINK